MNTTKVRKRLHASLAFLFTPILLALGFSLYTTLSVAENPNQSPTAITDSMMLGSWKGYVNDLYQSTGANQAGLDKDVFTKALSGYYNLMGSGKVQKPLLTILDFSRSSKQQRLWTLDLQTQKLVYHTLVAHGQNSGEEYANQFSNRQNTNMSSLGFFVTAETYNGKHGISLFIDGQEENFNSNARERRVVMHGADYVSPDFIADRGRLGRSFGCPALPSEMAPEMIEKLAGGSVLYIYHPSPWYHSRTMLENTTGAVGVYTASISGGQADSDLSALVPNQ